jgi:uncharacterized Rmd1/YagE family protein
MHTSASPITATEFRARALLVGERLHSHVLRDPSPLAAHPTILPVGAAGAVVLFRYGVAVFFNCAPMEEGAFLERLRPAVTQPYPTPEVEEIIVRIDPEHPEWLTDNVLYLDHADLASLQIVADALSKSALLSLYEARIASDFDRIEPLAQDLSRTGSLPGHTRELLKDMGALLLTEHRMVGRAEIMDKPEALWEHPELEALFVRIEDEFEIHERHRALERKIGLISQTARTLIDLLQHRHSLRVEWYIVALIVVEIFLTVYQLFFMPLLSH